MPMFIECFADVVASLAADSRARRNRSISYIRSPRDIPFFARPKLQTKKVSLASVAHCDLAISLNVGSSQRMRKRRFCKDEFHSESLCIALRSLYLLST